MDEMKDKQNLPPNLREMELSNIADLNQTISDAYSKAEVQAISDKVDAILAELRGKGWMAQS